MASVEWKQLISSKHNQPYWFNEVTGESRWEKPSDTATQHLETLENDDARHCRKRPRVNEKGENDLNEKEPYSSAVVVASAEADEGNLPSLSNAQTQNCPEHLLWKRNYLFKGFRSDDVKQLKMDEVSAFSITETRSASCMTDLIWQGLLRATHGIKRTGDSCILDGMACVGGNTISFATQFTRVISNELDTARFGMLQHNTRTVMKRDNVEFFNRSVLEIAFERNDYDVIFLDPEWGGPDYKDKTHLVLPISGQSMEEFCLNVLSRMSRVSLVALKLPLNYDNKFIEAFSRENSLTYEFFTDGLKKMSLTLLTKKGKF